MAVITRKQRWDQPIFIRFPMSEATAHENLNVFFSKGVKLYEKERSRTDKEYATSKLSVHLRIGTISPYELYWKTEDCGLGYDRLKTFSRRLFWRDLAYYQLVCFPQMRTKSIREHYENTDWVTGKEEKRRFEAWKWGNTGYPIVDAGMRELYGTGWMTQSVRMVVASFLVEYLRVNWVKGCEWFHYTLVDADSAINAMMWQNAGKSGIDQWNFVLSPETASQDPSGAYTRKWVPELVALPTTELIHRPWLAPREVLDQAGIILGETYPRRIVADLKSEREISVQSTLDMRRRSQDANSDRGYDYITLPDGKRTVVFTKKEYRIDTTGQAIKVEPPGRNSKQPVKGRSSRRGRRVVP
jgi:deoxyribodipyrimidine photolyase